MDFKRNILKVFSANFLSLISGITIGFIVPAILSVEEYGTLKTFTFYIGYITIFHLGLVDGLYIKYGGKTNGDICLEELKSEYNVLMIIEIIFTSIILGISIINCNIMVFILALCIFPINMVSFHKQFYQAIGEFDRYAKIMNLYTLIYLVLNILLAVVFKEKNYIYYCLTTLISNVIILIISEIKFRRKIKGVKAKYNKKIINHIKIGFLIMIGNFAVSLFYAIDRWIIKGFYSMEEFAYYSFAVSILNMANIVIVAISAIFYNYLCKNKDKSDIRNIKNILIIIASIASFGYFVFAFIIRNILMKYIPALNVIAISFAAYPYIIVINSLYINFYKTGNDKRKYVKVVLLMTLIALVYNLIAVLLYRNIESIAFATTMSFITWYIYSMKDFKFLKCNLKEIIFLVIITISFLALSHSSNLLFSGTAYVAIVICCSVLLYRNETKFLKKELLKVIRGKK